MAMLTCILGSAARPVDLHLEPGPRGCNSTHCKLNSMRVECRPFSLCETEWLSERWSLHIFMCMCP
jgi:hypothetical protein